MRIVLTKHQINVDTIIYLSLYYLVNDLVHFPNSTINKEDFRMDHKNGYFSNSLGELSTLENFFFKVGLF